MLPVFKQSVLSPRLINTGEGLLQVNTIVPLRKSIPYEQPRVKNLGVEYQLEPGIVDWAYISALAIQDRGIEPAPTAGHGVTAELTVTFKKRIYPGAATP